MFERTCAVTLRVSGLLRGVGGETGAVATEYGLLLALIAVAIVAAVAAFGTALFNLYTDANNSIPIP